MQIQKQRTQSIAILAPKNFQLFSYSQKYKKTLSPKTQLFFKQQKTPGLCNMQWVYKDRGYKDRGTSIQRE